MRLQFNNKLLTSLMLAVDYTLLSQGDAYTNMTGRFYPTTGSIYGLNVYTTPFRQLVNDASITGATQVSGIWVDGVFTQPGQNGLVSLNISEGTACFTGQPNLVTGQFAMKEFNTYLTTLPEEKLLFETKIYPRGDVTQIESGLPQSAQTYPAVFLKIQDSRNTPACLGGIDKKTTNVRVIICADSEFKAVAAVNILEDMAHRHLKIVEPTGLPFDALGGYTGVAYNYPAIPGIGDSYINSVRSTLLLSVKELNMLNPAVFPAFVDFELWTYFSP